MPSMNARELLLVRPEHASEMEGCTHSCRHIAALLDEGTSMTIYPVRFRHGAEGADISAALCRECFVRLPREGQICKN